jgi:hypothetical protein
LDNRFYLQALGITGLFIIVMIVLWNASETPASEADVQNANNTKTAIAMTGSYLLQPPTRTPRPSFTAPTFFPPTSVLSSTSTVAVVPSPTNTSLLAQFNTPISPIAASPTPLPTQSAAAQVPVFTATVAPHQNTKAPPLSHGSATPTVVQVIPPSTTSNVMQDPAEFARWYFTRVSNERDYQNLWDHYLTESFKTNVGSGLFEDYVWWWNSVERVDINAADVLENNGTDAYVRVNLTFHMKDGRVVENQVYEYDFLFDPSRGTWLFDASS